MCFFKYQQCCCSSLTDESATRDDPLALLTNCTLCTSLVPNSSFCSFSSPFPALPHYRSSAWSAALLFEVDWPLEALRSRCSFRSLLGDLLADPVGLAGFLRSREALPHKLLYLIKISVIFWLLSILYYKNIPIMFIKILFLFKDILISVDLVNDSLWLSKTIFNT